MPDGVRAGVGGFLGLRTQWCAIWVFGAGVVFGRGKLAFRWRDLPLKNLLLGSGEKERRRLHRNAGCLLYPEEVVESPDRRAMVALLSEWIPAWKE